jgi:hypothetical protein
MSGGGNIIDFGNSVQLEKQAILLDNPKLCKISNNGIHKMAPTAWENSAMPILNYEKIFAEKKAKL